MSWQACDWADSLEYDRVGPLAFRVLIKLANVAAADGSRAFRSNRQIAQELGVSLRSIQRAMRELEQQGLTRRGDQRVVEHMRKDRRPVVYDLALANPKSGADMALIEGWNEQSEEPRSRGDNGVTELSTESTTGRQKQRHGVTAAVVSNRTIERLDKDTKPSTVQQCSTTGQAHRINRKLGYCADCLTPIAYCTAPNRKEGAA